MSVLDELDYSWARPDPAAIAAAGIKVVNRYLWKGGKGITKAELEDLLGDGLGVALGYEGDQGDHLLGAAKGYENGARARDLMDALPHTAGLPIYYACDQQVIGDEEMQATLAYLRAADSPEHPARCYAQKSVCDAFARPAWQTLAWSDGLVSLHAVMYQWAINQTFAGSAVDYDQVLDIDQIGAAWPPGHVPLGSGTPIGGTAITPKPGGFLMALSDAQQTEALTLLRALKAAQGLNATQQQHQYNLSVQTNQFANRLLTNQTAGTAAQKARAAAVMAELQKLEAAS